jgi:hypothetical protein
VGIYDELGASVSAWNNAQRVGVGWRGGQDNIRAIAKISAPEETLTIPVAPMEDKRWRYRKA